MCSSMIVYLEVDLFTGMTELTELSTMRTLEGFTICQLSQSIQSLQSYLKAERRFAVDHSFQNHRNAVKSES